MKKILSLTLALLASLSLSAANDYTMLQTRAERSFEWGEWANASTLYTLMAHERPQLSANYARAIVCNAMTGDTLATPHLFSQAMHHGVPLDSLFDGVRRAAFAVRQADVYPRFLKSARRFAPWVGRAVDARLLDWYLFRQNGPEIVRYASMMLQGLPDSVEFLAALARGYMLQGDSQRALKAWEQIIKVDPENYQGLVSAGNLAADLGMTARGLEWLKRAARLRPSAYLQSRINALSSEAAEQSGGGKP